MITLNSLFSLFWNYVWGRRKRRKKSPGIFLEPWMYESKVKMNKNRERDSVSSKRMIKLFLSFMAKVVELTLRSCLNECELFLQNIKKAWSSLFQVSTSRWRNFSACFLIKLHFCHVEIFNKLIKNITLRDFLGNLGDFWGDRDEFIEGKGVRKCLQAIVPTREFSILHWYEVCI